LNNSFFLNPTLFLRGCDGWIAESKETIGVVGFKMILCKLDVPKKTKNQSLRKKTIYINIPRFFGDILQKKFGRVFNEAENSKPAF